MSTELAADRQVAYVKKANDGEWLKKNPYIFYDKSQAKPYQFSFQENKHQQTKSE